MMVAQFDARILNITNSITRFGLQVQRYEGASTIYGPYTLPLYISQFEKLARRLKVCPRVINTLIFFYFFYFLI